MSVVQQQMAAPLFFTDNAVAKVRELIEEEENPDLKLRVFVTGGGCSGFSYKFDLDEAQNDDDIVIERDGAKVLIDEMSMEFMRGSEIDFSTDLIGAAFKINNPNATAACGCGTSFSI